MKLLIIGATYMSNFGDMLFAKLIIDKLYGKAEVRFALTSEFCSEFVKTERLSNFDVKDADALLYMPGGYLGDRHDTSLHTTYLWFKRYFPLGIYYARKKKPIMITAVDAGPCKYFFMRKVIKYVCNRSWKVILRNEDSRDFLRSIGVKNTELCVSSDYAHLIKNAELPTVGGFDEWKEKNKNKSKILVHVNSSLEAADVVIPAIERYYKEHREDCAIIVASDQVVKSDVNIFDKVKAFAPDAGFYKYADPLELCSVINGSDCVLTYKLHVGIVASAFSKSVIAIPQHYKKVQKYYKQIGYPERCLPLKDADPDKVYDLINRYSGTPVVLNNEICALSEKNNEYIDAFLRYVEECKR